VSDPLSRPVATCYLLDVGRHRKGHSGSSNVFLLHGSGTRKWPNAVVIDCGDQSKTTLRLLRKYNVNKILHIIVTHNDEDHCGGLVGVLNAFRSRVGTVWFLQDRPAREMDFYRELKRLRAERAIDDIRLLQAQRNRTRRTLFRTGTQKATPIQPPVAIDLLYPLCAEDSMDPQLAGDKNLASAVLYAYCGDGAILFPGDAQTETLQRAKDHFGATIKCDVLVVPHHGGKTSSTRWTETRLTEFYRSTLSFRFAVVSVATENRDRHPFPEHIQALVSHPSHVMCTQITDQCHADPPSIGEGVLAVDCETPQASERAGEANGVGCAGSVVLTLDGRRIEPLRWKEHLAAVAGLEGDPLCRRSSS
jgi:beta-lactamase superfamily II metal-dependent hydrolase